MTIFTKIINGEIPCHKIAESEKFIAFSDIEPLVEGHLLVVPKIEVDKLDPKVPLWGGLIAVAITYGLFLLFEKASSKNRTQIAFEEQDLLEHGDQLYSFPENKK